MSQADQPILRKVRDALLTTRSVLVVFFEWWSRELRQLLPSVISEFFGRGVPRLVVAAHAEDIFVRNDGVADAKRVLVISGQGIESASALGALRVRPKTS